MIMRRKTTNVDARRFTGTIKVIRDDQLEDPFSQSSEVNDRWLPSVGDVSLAHWCNGYITRDHRTEKEDECVLIMPEQNLMIVAGEWVVKEANGQFRCYSDEHLHSEFEPIPLSADGDGNK